MPTTISSRNDWITDQNQALELNKSAVKPLFSIREVLIMSHIRLIISDIDGIIL